jgi:hypothetical protein
MKKPTAEMFDDIKGFDNVYPDDSRKGYNDAFEDDCFIHIVRNGYRIVFYNGQGKCAFGGKDVSRFEKIVDKRLLN